MSATTDTRPRTSSESPPQRKSAFDWGQPFVYLVALVVVAITIAPVVYVVLGGFRSNLQITADPTGMPDPWILSNYERVLTSSRFWGQVLTSSIAAFGTTAGVVGLGVMAAFVIARYEFRGREAMYSLFTAGLLFPLTIAVLPLTVMLRDLGMFGSVWGLIVPQVAFALPVTIIILVPFLRAIPVELEDAAAIDGASRLGFFWRILLPLSAPGLVTVGVLAFVASWNAYLLPLFVLGAGGAPVESYTLPLGVQQFSTQYSSDTAGVLAFTSLAMIPALVFFLALQGRIVNGLQGAVKG
jgi:raffinose/stachyose/melibiose transport system permease protein